MEINYPLYENCEVNFEKNVLLWVLRNTGLLPFFLEAYQALGMSEEQLMRDIEMDNDVCNSMTTETRTAIMHTFNREDSQINIFRKTRSYDHMQSVSLNVFTDLGIMEVTTLRTDVIIMISGMYRDGIHRQLVDYYNDGQNVTLALPWMVYNLSLIQATGDRTSEFAEYYPNLMRSFFRQSRARRSGNISRFFKVLTTPVFTRVGSNLSNLTSDTIDSAFSWGDTAQPSSFWSEVHETYRRNINRWSDQCHSEADEDNRLVASFDAWPLCKIGPNIVEIPDVNLTTVGWVDELEVVA